MHVFVRFIAVATAVAGIAIVGSTIASSSIANRVDQVADSSALSPQDSISNIPEAIVIPATPVVTKVDFDQTFADVAAMPRPGNTPGNREKLRNAGWKLISASN